jgi:hypothetical protein
MTATISRLPPRNTYTLTYDEPSQVCHEPVQFEYNVKTYEYPADDERDARQKADAFLLRGKVSCNLIEAVRRGRYIDQTAPIIRRVHDYVEPNMVKAAANG